MLGAVALGRATGRVRRAHRQRVAVHLALVMVVQLAVAEVIDVIVVVDGRLAAANPC
jgi:hypothetical protein